MTNQEIWVQYKEYSQTVSEIARKFAFAGIAICWFLRDSNNAFPKIILFSLLLFLSFFLFDLLQYLITTFLLKIWMRKQEIKMWEETSKIEGNYQKPTWIDKPAFNFFISKLVVLLSAYCLLGYWLFKS